MTTQITAGNILRFDADERQLVIGEGFYQIPSFVALEKKSKKDYKNDCLLEYLFHVLHPNSVIDSLNLPQRILTARQMLDLSKEDCESQEVLRALSDYDSILQGDLSLKMLKSMTKGVTAITDYFDTVDFNKTIQSGANIGSLLYNPKILTDTVKQARPALQEVEALRKDVLESLKVVKATETRGGVDTGNFKRFK